MASQTLLTFLLALSALLLSALCMGRLAVRFGLPSVVGELSAGVLLGPSVLGHFAPGIGTWLFPPAPAQAQLVEAVGQLGVLLLVGVTGAHLHPSVIRRRGRTVFWVGLFSLVVPLVLGVALGLLVPRRLLTADGDQVVFALFLGVAMCVSAIPVIAKTLTDMGLLHRDVGQLILATGLTNDAVGWFLLSLVSAMATGVGISAGQVGLSLLGMIGVVVCVVFVGRPLVRSVLRRAARAGDGPTGAVTVVTVLVFAAATHAVGMEAILGAFVAGVLVGTSDPTVRARLEPLRVVVLSVLAPIFLASAGLRVDLSALWDREVLAVAVAVLVVAIVGKFAGAYLGARISRLDHWEGIALGAGLNARGVVEVVIAAVGLRLGVLTTAMYTTVILTAVVTSLMAPPLLRIATARMAQTPDELRRDTTATRGAPGAGVPAAAGDG